MQFDCRLKKIDCFIMNARKALFIIQIMQIFHMRLSKRCVRNMVQLKIHRMNMNETRFM
ncbi:hypothetical protein HMPREF1985_00501 [Mitsuokella sp. oral taxon 131 str. W9106]|nr:hypothetical protein HMPREF1985_00501 [Mitsuokella sp. oral taxon 131 str. W9106]